MTLETQRLVLRPWEEGDAPALYRYAQDPRVGPIAGWPAHTSVDDSRAVIRGVLSAPETYAVVLRETGEPVGSAGILFPGQGDVPMEAGEAEIGYWIGVPYWGRGLIPEAVEALLARCFTQLGCRTLWCSYFDGNGQSRRVMEKCGFTYHHSTAGAPNPYNGIAVTHVTRLTREEWRARRGSAAGGEGDRPCF